MENQNIYAITIVENIGGNETSVMHHGVVINDRNKAKKEIEKAFNERLNYWLKEWEVDGETIDDYFEIGRYSNEFEAYSDGDHIQVYLEEVDVL